LTNTAKAIIPGAYVAKQVFLHASRMIISYESEALSQPVSSGPKFFKCPRLLLYQRPNAFEVKLFASTYLHLDRNRFVEIELSSGWNNVLNGELHVRAATAGLRLQTSDVKVVDDQLEVYKKSEAGVIRFKALQPESKVKILVPFSLENDVNEISVKLELSYTTEKGTFFLATNPTISIMLPLGVNVQDLFKHKALYSKFTISSATSSPLRLLKSKLEPSDVFEARNGGDLPNPVMIFPRQPASLLYKITRRSTQAIQSGPSASCKKNQSSLSLIIHYVCLEEEINDAVASALSEALEETPLHQYNRLIVPTVLWQIDSRLSAYILERTALAGQFSTSILSGINWREFFSGLGMRNGQEEDIAASIARWIPSWCEQRPYISLQPIDMSQGTIAKSRSIIIPVDVPSVTAVHTADIKLTHKAPTSGEVVATTNEPIAASLEIKSTRIWDSSPTTEKTPSQAREVLSETANEINFVYEVSAPPDTWVIGGKRRGHFRIPSSKNEAPPRAFTFPIILIPIKEGYLPYPHLEIKTSPIPKPAASDGKGSSNGPTPADDRVGKADVITCETDYKNIGETIRVISNVRKTTVSLDASGPQGGAWLLESEKRFGENGAFVV
jgi:trafficking protein particle complex subunit 10